MYVRIIDQGECLSTTREYVDGVYANKNEWAKHISIQRTEWWVNWLKEPHQHIL